MHATAHPLCVVTECKAPVLSAHPPFTGGTVWQLREKWTIPTVKINNGKARNPAQWEDGTYSVEGAAARLGVFPGTIHKWLKGGKLTGYQLAKGMRRTGIFNRRRYRTAPRMASTSKTIKEKGIMTHSRKLICQFTLKLVVRPKSDTLFSRKVSHLGQCLNTHGVWSSGT